MNCLALDLGTTTGWAANCGTQFFYGREVLCSEGGLTAARKKRMDRRLDPRIPALYAFAKEVVDKLKIQLIVFEDVLFIRSTKQGQLWPAERAAVWLVAAHCGCQIDCLNTTALKTFATRQPSATKELMILSLRRAMPDLEYGRVDDNVADAVWLWRWAQERIRL